MVFPLLLSTGVAGESFPFFRYFFTKIARLPSDARRAAPSVPLTALITAVFLLEQFPTAAVSLAAALVVLCIVTVAGVTVTVAASAGNVVLAMISKVPRVVVILAVSFEQQFVESSDGRQQYTPTLHWSTFHF